MNKLMEFDLEFAKKLLLDFGSMSPMFIGRDALNRAYMIGGSWENDAQQAKVLDAVRLFFHENKVVNCTAVGEIWKAKVPVGESLLLRAMDNPERRECLMVVYQTATAAEGVTVEILRDASGKVSGFGPVEALGSALAGKMSDLLTYSPQGSDELRAMIRSMNITQPEIRKG